MPIRNKITNNTLHELKCRCMLLFFMDVECSCHKIDQFIIFFLETFYYLFERIYAKIKLTFINCFLLSDLGYPLELVKLSGYLYDIVL